jgi:hypothetical protein
VRQHGSQLYQEPVIAFAASHPGRLERPEKASAVEFLNGFVRNAAHAGRFYGPLLETGYKFSRASQQNVTCFSLNKQAELLPYLV